jgi:pimeloyl-ACP methyl ester carboxylesterase
MASYRRDSFLGLGVAGFHRIALHCHEPADARLAALADGMPPVICVHGLTRNGRDFDVLAAAIADQGRRVYCPDIIGRGESDWLADKNSYTYPQYMADMNVLIGRVLAEHGAEAVDWVGTSMGGLIGMMLAAMPKAPIRRLVMNDVGPLVPAEALNRLGGYVGKDPLFADMGEAEAYLRRVHAPFGQLSNAEWRHMAEASTRQDKVAGGYRLAYDPGIANVFAAALTEDINLWPVWEQVKAEVLVLRGAESDLLTAETASAMGERGPKAKVAEIAGCGHAPALMAPDQVAMITGFLQG